MKRVLVMGVSPGVGKSTFAKKLGEKLDLEVYHLDSLYWQPGWTERDNDSFRELQEHIVKKDSWIIDGNYSNSYDLRVKRADTVIYLELPLIVCMYRVIKRRIVYARKTREDMAKGCPEKVDWSFFTFILTTYRERKKKMRNRFKKLKNDEDYKVFMLMNRKDIENYIQNL
ncbi:topology modulation protein [Priestia megaterium]|jgi:adenylate kinase family enzyme|uniref:topology modulation protein n=1 Tax=Priestia megaterium TaxID=1404 RepID=UPI00138F9918|nr:topology modulation protein [Priestia megaterium]MCF8887656.1 topology modulation protein [Priestia megaterium]NEW02188.1 topology modulation protein [Priestia megaterium]